MKRNEYGGDTKFVCFDFKEKTEEFRLIPDVSPPKLDGFIKGMRYRIKTAMAEDNEEVSYKCTQTCNTLAPGLLQPVRRSASLEQL